MLSTYGCEDFDAPEKDSGTSSSRAEGGTTTNVTTGLESDAGSSEMDAAQKDSESSPAGDANIKEKKEENPLKTDFVDPQSSQAFIFVANPDHHCVTVIDGESLLDGKPPAKCIDCKEGQCVGDNPTYLGVDPSEDTAIVINKGTKHAAIIKKSRATESITEFEVVKGANAVRFAPGGKHAIVYYDPGYVGDTEEADSNQEITVVTLKETGSEDDGNGVATNMVVGLNPRNLVFQNNGEKAFFVTDEGISVLDFHMIDDPPEDASTIADTVDFRNRLDPAEAQIGVSPAGRFAIGFIPGSDELFQLDITQSVDRVENRETVFSLNVKEFFRAPGDNGGDGDNGDGDNGDGDNGSGGNGGSDDDAGQTSQTSPEYDFNEKGEIDPRPELPEDVIPGIADVAINPPASGSESFAMITIPDPGLVLKMPIPIFNETGEIQSDEAQYYLTDEKYDRVEISSSGKMAWLYNQADKELRTVVLDLSGDTPPAVLDEDWENWSYNHIKHIYVAYPITRAESLEGHNAIVAFHESSSALRSTSKGTGYTIVNLDKRAERFFSTPEPIRSYVVLRDAFFARTESNALSNYQIFRTGLGDLLFESIELQSKPNAIGAMDKEGIESIFVSHEHPDGHIILISEEGEIVTNPFIGFQIVNRVQE